MLAALSVPLFDPAAVPSPRPCTLAFAAARRRRQGRPSRKPRHNVRLREAAPWTVASTAAGLHGSGRRRSDDRHREVGARNALSAKPTMCTRMHRSQFPFRTSLQCAGMGTGTPIKRRDCCAIKLRERAYLALVRVRAGPQFGFEQYVDKMFHVRISCGTSSKRHQCRSGEDTRRHDKQA